MDWVCSFVGDKIQHEFCNCCQAHLHRWCVRYSNPCWSNQSRIVLQHHLHRSGGMYHPSIGNRRCRRYHVSTFKIGSFLGYSIWWILISFPDVFGILGLDQLTTCRNGVFGSLLFTVFHVPIFRYCAVRRPYVQPFCWWIFLCHREFLLDTGMCRRLEDGRVQVPSETVTTSSTTTRSFA